MIKAVILEFSIEYAKAEIKIRKEYTLPVGPLCRTLEDMVVNAAGETVYGRARPTNSAVVRARQSALDRNGARWHRMNGR